MDTIELAFYRGEGRLFDRLIRWWTESEYSHCEIVLSRKGDEAVLFSASPRDGGVRRCERTLVPERWDVVRFKCRLPPLDLALLMREEDGAKYDWLGIIWSQVFARGWQSRKRWFCSEICGHAAGIPEPHRYSPEGLRRLVLFLNERG